MSMFKRLFGSREAKLRLREEQIEAELAKITEERIQAIKSPDGSIDMSKLEQAFPEATDITDAYEYSRQPRLWRFFKTDSTRAKSPSFREAVLTRELFSIREQLAKMSNQDKR